MKNEQIAQMADDAYINNCASVSSAACCYHFSQRRLQTTRGIKNKLQSSQASWRVGMPQVSFIQTRLDSTRPILLGEWLKQPSWQEIAQVATATVTAC